MSQEEVESLITQLHDARAREKEAHAQASDIQKRLIAAMASDNETEKKKQEGGLEYTATLVEPMITVINQPKLKKRIGALLWNQLSPRVLDTKRLEAAMQGNPALSTAVAGCATEQEGTKYVKVTTKKARRDAG